MAAMLEVSGLSMSLTASTWRSTASRSASAGRDRGDARGQRGGQILLPQGAGRDGAAHAGRRISLGSADLADLPAHDIVEAGLALVPEDRGIFPSSPCARICCSAPIPPARGRTRPTTSKVVALFPRLGERMGQLTRTMSGGERQMLAIGRALMSSPDILLLDEPSLGLSPLVCKELFPRSAASGSWASACCWWSRTPPRASRSAVAAICWRTAASSARVRRDLQRRPRRAPRLSGRRRGTANGAGASRCATAASLTARSCRRALPDGAAARRRTHPPAGGINTNAPGVRPFRVRRRPAHQQRRVPRRPAAPPSTASTR